MNKNNQAENKNNQNVSQQNRSSHDGEYGVPNRAHTEMNKAQNKKKDQAQNKNDQSCK